MGRSSGPLTPHFRSAPRLILPIVRTALSGAPAAQASTMAELHGQAQKYNAQLQEYNGRLQTEARGLKDAVAGLQAAKDAATEVTAALRGQLTAAETQIATATVRSGRTHSSLAFGTVTSGNSIGSTTSVSCPARFQGFGNVVRTRGRAGRTHSS